MHGGNLASVHGDAAELYISTVFYDRDHAAVLVRLSRVQFASSKFSSEFIRDARRPRGPSSIRRILLISPSANWNFSNVLCK